MGRIQPTFIGVIVHLRSTMDIQVDSPPPQKKRVTLPQTNIAPKKVEVEHDSSFNIASFQVLC